MYNIEVKNNSNINQYWRYYIEITFLESRILIPFEHIRNIIHQIYNNDECMYPINVNLTIDNRCHVIMPAINDYKQVYEFATSIKLSL